MSASEINGFIAQIGIWIVIVIIVWKVFGK